MKLHVFCAFEVALATTITLELQKVADYANHQRHEASVAVILDFSDRTLEAIKQDRIIGFCRIKRILDHITKANQHLQESAIRLATSSSHKAFTAIEQDIAETQSRLVEGATAVQRIIHTLGEAKADTADALSLGKRTGESSSAVSEALKLFLRRHDENWIKQALSLLSKVRQDVTTYLAQEHFGKVFSFTLGKHEPESSAECSAWIVGDSHDFLKETRGSHLDQYTADHLQAALKNAGYSETMEYSTEMLEKFRALEEAMGGLQAHLQSQLLNLELRREPAPQEVGKTDFAQVFDHINTQTASFAPDARRVKLLQVAGILKGVLSDPSSPTLGRCIDPLPAAPGEMQSSADVFKCLMGE